MKVKVFNKNKFNVGIRLINPLREMNIIAGSFVNLEEDDIYYLNTICTLFQRGMLTIENKEENNVVNENLGFSEPNPNFKSEDEIEDILSITNFQKMKKELSLITEPHVIDAVYRVAKRNMDSMTGAKLKFISEFCKMDLLSDEF